MIEKPKISILYGGLYRCTPAWTRDKDTYHFSEHFSFLLPVSGSALIETTAGKCRLARGRIFFIPGHYMVRQVCEKEMLVYWVNLVSESYYLHHRLLGIHSVKSWPLDSMGWVEPIFHLLVDLFEDPETENTRLRTDPPAGVALKIEGALMVLLGYLIESTETDVDHGALADLERVKPAIDFMDEHYLRNPSLAEIAKQVTLSSTYFHRYFKREAGITPFKYMENRRLDYARKLLFDRRLNITEVAEKAGYSSLFYFSAAFRRRFGLSPSRLRRAP